MNNKGETLVESLASIVIITFAIMAITTCLVSTARINSEAKLIVTSCDEVKDSTTLASSGSFTIIIDGSQTIIDDVRGFSDEGFFYYDY